MGKKHKDLRVSHGGRHDLYPLQSAGFQLVYVKSTDSMEFMNASVL